MEPGLAARHPDIKTYDGVGIDDPTATVAADTGPLGFHASVRAATGSWYIDPYYHLDTSVYISYYGRDLLDNPHGTFVENGVEGSPEPLDALNVPAARATATVQLRTYRLALVTDPTYATYFGGAANVTAAKVTLMNRVDQFYEDESAIRMVLIADNDKLNLDTAAEATGANGPCGAAACYTASQLSNCGSSTLSRNRVVLGQIIGASNYDIGHIGLGVAGGGVASLGVVGGNAKGQGCTGVPTPVGDFYAIDYVAHEMGHEFAGNHTFNGTQSNCSGGNRNAATSVEPGSGSSVMAYAGICQQDNLQPHSDPYWSQRSYDEIAAYTSTPRPAISEVQTVSLSGFAATDSLTLGYGANTIGADRQRHQLHRRRAPGRAAGAVRGADRPAHGLHDRRRLLHAELQRGEDRCDRPRPEQHGGRDRQRDPRRQRAAAGHPERLCLGNAVVPGRDRRAGLGCHRVRRRDPVQRQHRNGDQRDPGFAGTVAATGAGNTGFTLTFGGASSVTDVPAVSIVNCTGGCTSSVRETAKGGTGLSNWPANATVTASTPTDSGYQLTFSGSLQSSDVDPFSVTDPSSGVSGAVLESTEGRPRHPPGRRDGDRRGVRWGHVRRDRLPGFVRRHAGQHRRGAAGAQRDRRHRLRRRDRRGRPGRQPRLPGHRHRRPPAGRHRTGAAPRSRPARRSR